MAKGDGLVAGAGGRLWSRRRRSRRRLWRDRDYQGHPCRPWRHRGCRGSSGQASRDNRDHHHSGRRRRRITSLHLAVLRRRRGGDCGGLSLSRASPLPFTSHHHFPRLAAAAPCGRDVWREPSQLGITLNRAWRLAVAFLPGGAIAARLRFAIRLAQSGLRIVVFLCRPRVPRALPCTPLLVRLVCPLGQLASDFRATAGPLAWGCGILPRARQMAPVVPCSRLADRLRRRFRVCAGWAHTLAPRGRTSACRRAMPFSVCGAVVPLVGIAALFNSALLPSRSAEACRAVTPVVPTPTRRRRWTTHRSHCIADSVTPSSRRHDVSALSEWSLTLIEYMPSRDHNGAFRSL